MHSNIENLNKSPIRFKDTEKLLDLRYDNVFKAVFTRDTPASKRALSGLISALIGRKITVDIIIANEPPVNSVFDHCIRFDIACKTESGELVNIEMSSNPDSCEPVRLEYHAARQFSGQGIRGVDKGYADLVETFQITVLCKYKYFADKALVHTFQYYDPVRNVSLGGKTRVITLELSKVEQIIDKSTDDMDASEKWSVFFEYLTKEEKRGKINELLEKEDEIAMAGETLMHISQDEIEFARLTSELKYELDNQSHRVNARREGLAEGRAEGRAEGQKEAKKHFMELLNQGLSIEEIKQRL